MIRCQCKLKGCHRKVRVKHLGLCHMHSMRYYRHGDPLVKLPSGPKVTRQAGNRVELTAHTMQE